LKDSTRRSDADYDRVIGRIARIAVGLAIAGAGACGMWMGWMGTRSFAAGALVSGFSFWTLHRLVADVGRAAQGEEVKPRSTLFHAGRFLVIGGAVFVILRLTPTAAGPFTAGLLVCVAAATVEALIEVIYARSA
jgi:hypothetical protein